MGGAKMLQTVPSATSTPRTILADGNAALPSTDLSCTPGPCPFPHSTIQKKNQKIRLLVILLALLANNIEELERVLALGGAYNAQPVAELLLLEELLGEVLEVATRELLVGDDLDAAITEVVHGDDVAQVARQAVDLDALLQERGERRRVEDAILRRLRGVDDVLLGDFGAALFGGCAFLWKRYSAYCAESGGEGSGRTHRRREIVRGRGDCARRNFFARERNFLVPRAGSKARMGQEGVFLVNVQWRPLCMSFFF